MPPKKESKKAPSPPKTKKVEVPSPKSSPKASPTSASPPKVNQREEAFEKLGAVFEAQRGNMTLLSQPLHTLRYFLEISVIEGATLLFNFLRHPVTMFVLIPMVAAAVFCSIYYVPSHHEHLFTVIDADADGSITAPEIAAAISSMCVSCPTPLVETPLASVEALSAWMAAPANAYVTALLNRLPHHWWREVEFIIADVLWWFGLGVVSSVGLGTGMHSGLLFLFPHIFLTCASADACRNTQFWTYPVNLFYGPRGRAFECVGEGSFTVSFFERLVKVVPWCIIWGGGTALGEVPPYLLSYAAAKEGKKTDELEEVSSFDILNRMKNWMLEKIQKYGFWAILLLAAWPNAAFDLCGMACGQFMMPFWTFFGATFIGKALIKINGQAAFFVLLFSGDNIEDFIRRGGRLLIDVVPESLGSVKPAVEGGVNKFISVLQETHAKIEKRAKEGDAGAEAEEKEPNWLQIAMQWFVVAAVGWFAKSIIDTFAQKRAAVYDEAKIYKIVDKLAGKPVTEEVINKVAGDLRTEAMIRKIFTVAVTAAGIGAWYYVTYIQ